VNAMPPNYANSSAAGFRVHNVPQYSGCTCRYNSWTAWNFCTILSPPCPRCRSLQEKPN